MAFSLVIAFAFAIGCASLIAPTLSLASVAPGCSRASSAAQGMECPNPSLLCGFGSSQAVISELLPTPSRSHDFSKHVLLLAAHFAGDIPGDEPALAENSRFPSSGSTPRKISLHLFHSVLTL
ncbi:MAG TPA: hypothetical protein VNO43_06925 [Candidatus Eisenbacteria bacterium]|nr:hypothetical protein [Candidatus Eisenbacteria bacterium]